MVSLAAPYLLVLIVPGLETRVFGSGLATARRRAKRLPTTLLSVTGLISKSG